MVVWKFNVYHIVFISMMDVVVSVSPMYLFDLALRTNFLHRRKDRLSMTRQSMTIKRNRQEIETKEKQNARLSKQLQAATEAVKRAMAEVGAILSKYELQHADLDFGSEMTKLGEGSFGTVVKALLRGTTDVAVKTMRVSKINPKILGKFKDELIASTSART